MSGLIEEIVGLLDAFESRQKKVSSK